VELVVQKI